MRLYCAVCFKSVSNEVPEDTVFRAMAVCPECMERVSTVTFERFLAECREVSGEPPPEP